MNGDSSDGVPNVLSSDNCLVDHIRQSPMTKKKINEWWEGRENLKDTMPPEAFRNYMRNREMIDLERTPQAIQDKAVAEYKEYKYPSKTNILTYLIENRMKMLVELASEF